MARRTLAATRTRRPAVTQVNEAVAVEERAEPASCETQPQENPVFIGPLQETKRVKESSRVADRSAETTSKDCFAEENDSKRRRNGETHNLRKWWPVCKHKNHFLPAKQAYRSFLKLVEEQSLICELLDMARNWQKHKALNCKSRSEAKVPASISVLSDFLTNLRTWREKNRPGFPLYHHKSSYRRCRMNAEQGVGDGFDEAECLDASETKRAGATQDSVHSKPILGAKDPFLLRSSAHKNPLSSSSRVMEKEDNLALSAQAQIGNRSEHITANICMGHHHAFNTLCSELLLQSTSGCKRRKPSDVKTSKRTRQLSAFNGNDTRTSNQQYHTELNVSKDLSKARVIKDREQSIDAKLQATQQQMSHSQLENWIVQHSTGLRKRKHGSSIVGAQQSYLGQIQHDKPENKEDSQIEIEVDLSGKECTVGSQLRAEDIATDAMENTTYVKQIMNTISLNLDGQHEVVVLFKALRYLYCNF